MDCQSSRTIAAASSALTAAFFRFAVMLAAIALVEQGARAENWPRWRGPDGNAVSTSANLPTKWSPTEKIRWKALIPGEGSSSPIVWNDRIFLTSALEDGARRAVHCLDVSDGRILWSREVADENPELTSAITGHAAATPATNGTHIVAMFGNAGAVCHDFNGHLIWQKSFGEFKSELGLASSPVIVGDLVILLCDHDGDRFKTFDSFLTALDIKTGTERWRTDRPGLYRSWSTPLVVPVDARRQELVVNAQDELRGYDPVKGRHVWTIRGMTGWVTPSPVFAQGLVFACSGKDGPTMAIRPGGTGDSTESHVIWQKHGGAPYVCSPVLYRGLLYVQNESGVLMCCRADSGEVCYRTRLKGKFMSSPIAGSQHIYATNDEGTTYVIGAGSKFEMLAENHLGEECLASPAVTKDDLLIRTEKALYCIRRSE